MKELNIDTDLSGEESDTAFNDSAQIMSSSSESSEAKAREISMASGEQVGHVLHTDPEPEKQRVVPRVRISDFKILKVLGKGAYGKVFQVKKMKGPGGEGKVYAMKAMNKSRICGSKTDVRHTKAERNVLVSIDYPFIVKLKFAFETSERLYLVQEFCCGGELFRRMEVEKLMIETTAKFYLQEILLAIEYLHSYDIVYRDLKTENVMLDREGHVKLIDFGLSKTDMSNDRLTHTFCGTVEYMAPEVILKDPGYGKPADWWSFGIFTFDLLAGRSPFHTSAGKQATKERIMKAKFITPKIITPDANDFIRKLLRKPADRRLGSTRGAIELKSHPFFRGTDWKAVEERQCTPPFIPTVRSADDTGNFDTMFTSLSPRESSSVPINKQKDIPSENLRFEDFGFVAEEFIGYTEDDPSIASPPRERGASKSSTSGVSSGASSVSNSLSVDSLNEQKSPEQTTDLDQINELRICNHGS